MFSEKTIRLEGYPAREEIIARTPVRLRRSAGTDNAYPLDRGTQNFWILTVLPQLMDSLFRSGFRDYRSAIGAHYLLLPCHAFKPFQQKGSRFALACVIEYHFWGCWLYSTRAMYCCLLEEKNRIFMELIHWKEQPRCWHPGFNVTYHGRTPSA